MKKFYILIPALLSSLVLCTNNPTETVAAGDYRDSIVIDLFSYNVYNFTHFKQYYGSTTVTAKGQALLQPIDTISTLRSFDTNNYATVIVPKYVPNRYEAWLDNPVPLVEVEETDPELLVKAYSFSKNYFFAKDTASENLEKCIRPVDMLYHYGYGFVVHDRVWGCGKLKIYYK